MNDKGLEIRHQYEWLNDAMFVSPFAKEKRHGRVSLKWWS